MSLKVGVQVQVTQMDGSEVLLVSKVDTVINPNPHDPTAEALLAIQAIESLVNDLRDEGKERMDEYGQALARLLGGG